MKVDIVLDRLGENEILVKEALLMEFKGDSYEFNFIDEEKVKENRNHKKIQENNVFIFTSNSDNIDNLKEVYSGKDKIMAIFLIEANSKFAGDLGTIVIDEINKGEAIIKGLSKLILDGITKTGLINLDERDIKYIVTNHKILNYQGFSIEAEDIELLESKIENKGIKGKEIILGIEANENIGLNEVFKISNVITNKFDSDSIIFYVNTNNNIEDRKIKFAVMGK